MREPTVAQCEAEIVSLRHILQMERDNRQVAIGLAVAAERAACAKICDEVGSEYCHPVAVVCARKIREREGK